MLRNFSLGCLVLFGWMIYGCSSTNQLKSNAQAYENAGLYNKAFEEYRILYERNGNAQAFVGMNNVAKRILSQSQDQVFIAAANQDFRRAIDEIDIYQNQLKEYKSLGMEFNGLRSPEAMESDIRAQWATLCVDQAREQLMKGDFESADKWIRELQYVNRNDPRINGLQTLSVLAEKYAEAQNYLQLELDKQAYRKLDEIVYVDASFANALELRDSLLVKLSYSLACIVIDNEVVSDAVEMHTSNRIQQKLLEELENYVHLVERQELELVLEEQRHNMTAAFDEFRAIEAGQLAGARFILSGRFLEFDVRVDEDPAKTKLAFKGKSAGFSKRVKYKEYHVEWNKKVVFNWKLLDAQTGRVHRSGSIPFTENGETTYAEYQGDFKELYPGEALLGRFPTPWDRVHKEQKAREEFRQMFEENFEKVPDKNQMEEDIFSTIAGIIAQELVDFIPEN